MNPSVFTADFESYSLAISALADMDVGDTAYITAYQTSGAAQVDIAVQSFFCGHLVC
jgi:hypothetical protein